MQFSLPSPFSITRFNFFCLYYISIINQSFAFSPGEIFILNKPIDRLTGMFALVLVLLKK